MASAPMSCVAQPWPEPLRSSVVVPFPKRDEAGRAPGAAPGGSGSPHEQDRALMAQVVAGDPGARRKLVRALLPMVRRVTRTIVRDEAAAEDAVQVALMEILGSAHTYRGETAARGWAKRIVVRTAMRQLKAERRRRGILEPEGDPERVGRAEPARVADAVPREITHYLAQLTEVQREALVLRHVLGCTVAEVAERTGVSVNTAKARLMYGRRALRKLVRRDVNLGVAGEQGRAGDAGERDETT